MEWVAISFSRESSQPRDQTPVSHIVYFNIISSKYEWSWSLEYSWSTDKRKWVIKKEEKQNLFITAIISKFDSNEKHYLV